jgi:hypothetical protein
MEMRSDQMTEPGVLSASTRPPRAGARSCCKTRLAIGAGAAPACVARNASTRWPMQHHLGGVNSLPRPLALKRTLSRSAGGVSARDFGERLQLGAGDVLLAFELAHLRRKPLAIGAGGAPEMLAQARRGPRTPVSYFTSLPIYFGSALAGRSMIDSAGWNSVIVLAVSLALTMCWRR